MFSVPIRSKTYSTPFKLQMVCDIAAKHTMFAPNYLTYFLVTCPRLGEKRMTKQIYTTVE